MTVSLPTPTRSAVRPHHRETYEPGATIGEWRPEDEDFWQFTGRAVAQRNLWVSIPALMLGFVVWQVWSVTVVKLNDVGFGFSKSQLFWLTAIPKREKGSVNGLNGGLGNLGVSVVQLVAPLVVTTAVLGAPAGGPQHDAKGNSDIWLQNGAFLWVPLLVIMALLAWFLMNDLRVAAAPFSQQKIIFKRKHNPEGRGAEAQAAAMKQSEMEAGAVTGFSSAIAAYGFFFIPAMFAAMAVTSALWLFIGFYTTCLTVCWWFYARQGAEAPSCPGRGRGRPYPGGMSTAPASDPQSSQPDSRPEAAPAAGPRPRLVFDDPLDQQSSDDTDRGWGERPPAGGAPPTWPASSTRSRRTTSDLLVPRARVSGVTALTALAAVAALVPVAGLAVLTVLGAVGALGDQLVPDLLEDHQLGDLHGFLDALPGPAALLHPGEVLRHRQHHQEVDDCGGDQEGQRGVQHRSPEDVHADGIPFASMPQGPFRQDV